MAWKFQSARPIYQQAAEIVEKRVMSGQYPLGSKLPAVRDLAAEAGVNPNTMQKALQILEQKGVVYSPSTAGRFVTEDRNFLEELKVQVIRDKLQELHLQMQEFGYSPEQIQAFFKLL